MEFSCRSAWHTPLILLFVCSLLLWSSPAKAIYEEKKSAPEEFSAPLEVAPGEVLIKLRKSSAQEQQSSQLQAQGAVSTESSTPEQRILSKIPEILSISKIATNPGNYLGIAAKDSTIPPPLNEADQWYIAKLNSKVSSLREFCEGLPQTSEDIIAAEPNYLVRIQAEFPNDSRFGELWGLHNTGQSGGTEDADIDAPEAWEITKGSKDIIVAVLDTGVDYNHPDLAANMWVNEDEIPGNGIDDDNNGYVDDVHGYDFANNDGDPLDDHLHGTHVAGTIGAIGDNGIGVTGVNQRVRIMALKFLTASGSGSTATAIQAIRYATANGAQITNNSWGGGGFSQALQDAIAEAKNGGTLTIAAAGNDNTSRPSYPAAMEHVVSVAATNRNDVRAFFSNYGSTVDISAPGRDILSTFPTFKTKAIRDYEFSTHYGSISGTSMATPHVAGVAALVLANSPNLSLLELELALLAGVDNIDDENPTFAGKLGGGRTNARKALNALTEQPLGVNVISFELDNGFSPDEKTKITFQLRGNGFIAENVVAELVSTSPHIEIFTGASALGSIDFKEIATAEFEIKMKASAPETGRIDFTLQLSADNGELSDYQFSLSRLHRDRKWIKEFHMPTQVNGMTVVDLDGDRKKEIIYFMRGSIAPNEVLPQTNGTIYALNHDGTERSGFPLVFEDEEIFNVAVGDINSDGEPELVLSAASYNGSLDSRQRMEMRLYALRADGSVLPNFPIETTRSQLGGNFAIALTDITGDGNLEIIHRQWDFHLESESTIFNVAAYTHEGELVPGWPTESSDSSFGWYMAVGDLDGNGFTDAIYTSSSARTIHAADHEGDYLPGWPLVKTTDLLWFQTSPLALADLDGDGTLEILADPVQGSPQAISSTKEKLWERKVGGTHTDTLQVLPVDLERSGKVGAVFSDESGKIHAVHHDGRNVDGWPAQPEGVEVFPVRGFQMVVGDTDGDKFPEIWMPSMGSGSDAHVVWLNGFNHDGTAVEGFPKAYSANDVGFWPRYIVLEDLDGNGTVEFISIRQETRGLGGKTHLSVLELGGQYDKRQMDWPMKFHDPEQTGEYIRPVRGEDISAPKILTQPRKTIGGLGETVEFIVAAVGSTDFDYQWLRNGSAIPGANSSRYKLVVSSNAASKRYSCRVSNTKGSVLSREAVLEIAGNRHPTIQSIENKKVGLGETLRFRVSASDPDRDPLSYQAANLPPSASFDQTTGTFDYSPTPGEVGIFPDVIFEVSDGELTARVSIEIEVTSGPSNYSPQGITKERSPTFIWPEVEGAVGYRLTLIRDKTGTKSNINLQSPPYKRRNNFPYEKYRWSLFARYEKNGAYQPVQEDLAFEVIPSTVEGPTIVQQPNDIAVETGDLVKFKVKASGTSPISYQWLRNGVLIRNAISPTFALLASTEDDNARFSCRVSNPQGSIITREAKLSLGAAPNTWHNAAFPEDTNADNHITPIDAIRVINYLLSGNPTYVENKSNDTSPTLYPDVNNNGYVSPGDVIKIIQAISAQN